MHSPPVFPSLRNTSGKQSLSLGGKLQLECLSVGKTLQLQVFALWETCLDLFPESTQMSCCRQITQPPLHGLSAAICLRGLVEAHAACWSPEGLPVSLDLRRGIQRGTGDNVPTNLPLERKDSQAGDLPGDASVTPHPVSGSGSPDLSVYSILVGFLWFFLNKTTVGKILPDS